MMVRSISLALSALLLGATVMAQTPAAGNAAVSPMPAPTASATSRAVSSSVNPFTGVPLDFEQKQRLIEDAKLQTTLYKEQLEQGKVKIDLTLLPLAERAARMQLGGGANTGKVDTMATGPKVATRSYPRKAPKPSVQMAMPLPPVVPSGSGFIEFAGDGGSRERVSFGNSNRAPGVVNSDMSLETTGANGAAPNTVPKSPPLPPAMARPVPIASSDLAGTVGAGTSFR